MLLKGVIFDMDGTIVDAPYDWKKIKSDLVNQDKPILSFLKSLKEPERSEKWKILEEYEDKATKKAVLKDGIPDLLDFLTEKGVRKVLVTNNSRRNVTFLLNKFKLRFDYVISRESGLWKPSGAPFIAVMERLKLRREECCVIGDSHFDIKAAVEAKISKIFILNRDRDKFDRTKAEVFDSVKKLKKKLVFLV